MKNPLLPVRGENNHNLPRAVIVVFTLVTIVTLGRSLAHIFLPDGGAHSIATIISFDGTPDPDVVVHHIFALWGLAQLAMGVIYLLVLVRYRNLIPLMWVFILAEYLMRIVIGRLLKPLGPDFFAGTAPGAVGNYVLVPLSVVMILWSLYRNKSAGPGGDKTDQKATDQALAKSEERLRTALEVVNEGPTRIVGTHTDITRQRCLEDTLRESEKRYRNIFQNTLVSIWEEDFEALYDEINRLKAQGITDFKEYLDAHPEAVGKMAGMIKVVDVNDVTLRWYGAASKEEMLGSIEGFITDGSSENVKQEIIAIAEGKTTVEGESKGKTLDGREIDVSIRTLLPEPDENPKRMIVAINDITELKKAIRQKEILMREVSHRVKNNLMMISSLIRLKEKEIDGAADLSDLQRQVSAVMMVHDDLHHSEKLGEVKVERYIKKIIETVFSFSDKVCTSDFSIDVDYLPSKIALPVGLIVNELVTNALKHGFRDQNEGVCAVDFVKDDAAGQYVLTISNNGAPFPEDISLDNPETLGLRLVSALVKQLGGTIELKRSPHPVFTICFPAGEG